MATKATLEKSGGHQVAPPPETTSMQGEHNHGHDHDDHHVLMHHFDDMEQQRESISLGMWTFLMTEIMMFSGLFFCYAFFRYRFHDAYMLGSQQLDINLGTANTFVLLASSMTMAMAVHAAQVKNRKALIAYMIGTLIFGGAFLGVKAVEWSTDYREGLVPEFHALGPRGNWNPALWRTVHHAPKGAPELELIKPDSTYTYDFKHKIKTKDGREVARPVSVQQVKMYFILYFCMTGLHAIHMIAGALILLVMLVMAMGGKFTNGNDQPVEIFGLYWHFVDIVWVFLFPLLYLIAGFHPSFLGGGH